MFAALGDAMRTPEGMDALYQATWPLVLEEGPYTAGTFIVYDVVSKWLLAAMPPPRRTLPRRLAHCRIEGAASAILSTQSTRSRADDRGGADEQLRCDEHLRCGATSRRRQLSAFIGFASSSGACDGNGGDGG